MSKHARYIKEHKLLISLVILLLVIFYFNYNLLKIIMAKETGAQNIPIVSPIASLIVSLVPPSHTDFREISKGDTAKKQVIITIDAGAGDKSAEGILTALSKRKMKGTFFLVGEWILAHQELTRRLVREGHEIYNHSYSHLDYTKLTADMIKADLQKMDDTLYKVAGIRTRPYFRTPFGYRNETVRLAGAETGFQHIYWSVDSIDWRKGETKETIKNRVLSNIHPGAIILLHIGDIPTGDAIEELFTEIERRGYKLVSLTEGL